MLSLTSVTPHIEYVDAVGYVVSQRLDASGSVPNGLVSQQGSSKTSFTYPQESRGGCVQSSRYGLMLTCGVSHLLRVLSVKSDPKGKAGALDTFRLHHCSCTCVRPAAFVPLPGYQGRASRWRQICTLGRISPSATAHVPGIFVLVWTGG